MADMDNHFGDLEASLWGFRFTLLVILKIQL